MYESFHDCIKGDAWNTWVGIIQDTPLPRSQDSWQAQLELFVEEKLPEEPAQKQLNYVKNTCKPKRFTSRQWVQRVKHINSLLLVMGKDRLSEEEIVKDIITQNLPEPWMKLFKLSGGHRLRKFKQALDILEVLESNESLYITRQGKKNKPRKGKTHQNKRETSKRNNKESAPSKTRNHLKNLCNHPRHTNASHKWKDCIYNRRSKNKR